MSAGDQDYRSGTRLAEVSRRYGEDATPMVDDLDRLEQVAWGATEGPWARIHPGYVNKRGEPDLYICACKSDQTVHELDATFIATFDPPTALSLISRLRRAEVVVEAARRYLDSVVPMSQPGISLREALYSLDREAT